MTQPKDFIIDKVSWHLQVKDNPESATEVQRRFRIIVDFLQQERLVVRELLKPHITPSDDFAIKASDLTEIGLEVMKAGYDKWLKKVVNPRKSTSDLSILERCLKSVRRSHEKNQS